MSEQPSDEWSQEELPEGFDVYDYDDKRARAGRLLVLGVFLLFLIGFLFAMYFSYQRNHQSLPNATSAERR